MQVQGQEICCLIRLSRGQSSLIGGKAYSRPGVFYGLFFIALRYTALQNAAEYSIDLNGPPQKRKFIVT